LAASLACALVACTRDSGNARTTVAKQSGSSRALASATAPAAQTSIVGEYAATWEPAEGVVKVEARFTARAGSAFTIDRGAEAFAKDIEVSADRDGAPWARVVRSGRTFEAATCAAGPCRLRYRLALRDAARKIDDLDVASEEGEIVEAPPSTWMLVPARAPRDLRLRFRVTCPEGSRFVTGVFHSTESPEAWDISIDDLWTSPYSAFGPLRVRTLPVDGGSIELAIAPGKLAVTDDELTAWVGASARAVSSYYGRFPMRSALVLLVASRGRWVGSGRTLAGGGGTVLVRIGERAPLDAYRADWVLVHEMIHLTFPSVTREQDWAEEGIATYAEPFARVRAGLVDEAAAWRGLVEGLPNGQPAGGDRGLDHTHTWGRIYWGGALFWFIADVEIRKRTQNRFGLEHALRGVVDAGGNNASRWPLVEVLAAGDRATGVPVLRDLYAEMCSAPHPVDLAPLLESLGVRVERGHVTFDDKAPLAGIRRAITRGTDAEAPSAH
jgi:predicted metalloprotease with PDZ domain